MQNCSQIIGRVKPEIAIQLKRNSSSLPLEMLAAEEKIKVTDQNDVEINTSFSPMKTHWPSVSPVSMTHATIPSAPKGTLMQATLRHTKH
ncbi:MAG: hypothetical protein IPJ20_22060 [Flammeovirgaceae bacterium]|nr:hypothetical protein [Flammeovirgaceae bacterium]